MKRARLTHYSNVPGSIGAPGDIVTGPDDLIDSWVAARGAVFLEYVSDEAPEPPLKRKRRNRALEAYEQSIRSDVDPVDG